MHKHERRFAHGQEYTTSDGLRFRIVRGRKTPRTPNNYADPVDLRIDVWANERWQPVHMETAFLLVNFFYENEDVLYPKPRLQGGDYFLEECRKAYGLGYQWPTDGIEIDRAS